MNLEAKFGCWLGYGPAKQAFRRKADQNFAEKHLKPQVSQH